MTANQVGTLKRETFYFWNKKSKNRSRKNKIFVGHIQYFEGWDDYAMDGGFGQGGYIFPHLILIGHTRKDVEEWIEEEREKWEKDWLERDYGDYKQAHNKAILEPYNSNLTLREPWKDWINILKIGDFEKAELLTSVERL